MVGSCKRKRRVSLLADMMILLAGVASCYPGEINSVGEADLVLTFFGWTVVTMSRSAAAPPMI